MAQITGFFAPGQEVTLVDAADGHPVEIVRVADVDEARRQISVDGYTHKFGLDGCGLPEEIGHYQPGGIVVDMKGNVIRGPGNPVWVPVRTMPARNHIRPVRDADRPLLEEAEAHSDLAYVLSQRLADIAHGTGTVPFEALRKVAELVGLDLAGLPELDIATV